MQSTCVSQGVCSPSPHGLSFVHCTPPASLHPGTRNAAPSARLTLHGGVHTDGKSQPKQAQHPAWFQSQYPSPDSVLGMPPHLTMHSHPPYVAMAHPYWIHPSTGTFHPGVSPPNTNSFTYATAPFPPPTFSPNAAHGLMMPMPPPMAMHYSYLPSPHMSMLPPGLPTTFPAPPLPSLPHVDGRAPLGWGMGGSPPGDDDSPAPTLTQAEQQVRARLPLSATTGR
jgi:hypothetical protein